MIPRKFRITPIRTALVPLLGAGVVVMLSACSDGKISNPPPPRAKFTGAVYSMSNAAKENQVVVFSQAPDGTLKEVQTIGAGAAGPGPSPTAALAPIATQNEMVLSPDNKFLFVVDAGDNKISSFKVRDPSQVNRVGDTFNGSLTLVGTIASGGHFPSSLTVHDNQLYVVNEGGGVDGGNITGFTFGNDGSLSPIPNSTEPLSGAQTPLPGHSVKPGGIVFSPDGKHLVVTEKATSLIDVYTMNNGVPGAPDVQPSDGHTPFGADFDTSGHFIVSNANVIKPGMPNALQSSVSSYNIGSDGMLAVIDAKVATFFTAACWIRLSENQKYVYTTNTGSNTITGYKVGSDGSLTLLNADGLTAESSVKLFDEAVAGPYLYVNAPQAGGVIGYKISSDGSLSLMPFTQAGDLPTATNEGIAAFQFANQASVG